MCGKFRKHNQHHIFLGQGEIFREQSLFIGWGGRLDSGGVIRFFSDVVGGS